MMTEQQLFEKLQLIERLFEGAATLGERNAAANARERIKQRLKEIEKSDPPVEYKFSLSDVWSRKLFTSLLRRYDIKPYRYYRQKHTTVMARVPHKFVQETLWPEFSQLNETLHKYLNEITEKIISENVFADNSEAEVIRENPELLSE